MYRHKWNPGELLHPMLAASSYDSQHRHPERRRLDTVVPMTTRMEPVTGGEPVAAGSPPRIREQVYTMEEEERKGMGKDLGLKYSFLAIYIWVGETLQYNVIWNVGSFIETSEYLSLA